LEIALVPGDDRVADQLDRVVPFLPEPLKPEAACPFVILVVVPQRLDLECPHDRVGDIRQPWRIGFGKDLVRQEERPPRRARLISVNGTAICECLQGHPPPGLEPAMTAFEEGSVALDLFLIRVGNLGEVLERPDRDDGVIAVARFVVGPTLDPDVDARAVELLHPTCLGATQREADGGLDAVHRHQALQDRSPTATDVEDPLRPGRARLGDVVIDLPLLCAVERIVPLPHRGGIDERGVEPEAVEIVADVVMTLDRHPRGARVLHRFVPPRKLAGDRIARTAPDPSGEHAGLRSAGQVVHKERCKSVNRGVLVRERRGEIAPQPTLDRSHEVDGAGRIHPEPLDRYGRIDLVRFDLEDLGELANEPSTNLVDRWRPVSRRHRDVLHEWSSGTVPLIASAPHCSAPPWIQIETDRSVQARDLTGRDHLPTRAPHVPGQVTGLEEANEPSPEVDLPPFELGDRRVGKGVVVVMPRLSQGRDAQPDVVGALIAHVEGARAEGVGDRVDAPVEHVIHDEDADEPPP
jgi:hypothetical protein